jgi:hypothetical protein
MSIHEHIQNVQSKVHSALIQLQQLTSITKPINNILADTQLEVQKTIFFAAYNCPNNFSIVNLSDDPQRWQEFQNEIRERLNIPHHLSLIFKLADINAKVTSTSDLSSNDIILVFF